MSRSGFLLLVCIATSLLLRNGHANANDLIQARYLASFSWTISGSVNLIPPPYVEVTCSPNAKAIWLESESLGWPTCVSNKPNSLRCTNIRTYSDGFAKLVTYVAVACEGSSRDDVATLTASVSEMTYSSTASFGSNILTRQIYIESICDTPKNLMDPNILRSTFYLPLRTRAKNVTCSKGSDGLGTALSICQFPIDCFTLTGTFFQACSTQIDPVSMTAFASFDNPLFSCLFSPELPNVPQIDTAKTIQYEVTFAIDEKLCQSDGHLVSMQCNDGGKLSFTGESSICTQSDSSAIACVVPKNKKDFTGQEVVSCTGNQIEQLVLTVTLDTGGLSCPSFSYVLRYLEVYQLCREKALLEGNLLGPYSDNLAVSCFPITSSYIESVPLRNERGETVSTRFELCYDNAGYACNPTCDKSDVGKIIATIRPEHLSIDCVNAGPNTSPTAISPSAIPPTAIPPSAIPPAAIPPSAISPTAIPPSAIPPAETLPTVSPPTSQDSPEPTTRPICFTAKSTVELKSGQVIGMTNLRVGDMIKVDVDTGNFEAVYGFAHRDEDDVSDYLKISWAPNTFLEISPSHMILVNDKMIPALQVKVGDSIKVDGAKDAKILSIESIQGRGAFAPLTYSGTLVVDKVQASSYVVLEGKEHLLGGAHSTFYVNYHWLAHSYLFPVRLIGKFIAAPLEKDILWWLPHFFMNIQDPILHVFFSLPVFFLVPCLLPVIVFFGFMSAVETLCIALECGENSFCVGNALVVLYLSWYWQGTGCKSK